MYLYFPLPFVSGMHSHTDGQTNCTMHYMDVEEIKASSTIVYTQVAAVSILAVPEPSYSKTTTYVYAVV